jgi:hypothetical protein
MPLNRLGIAAGRPSRVGRDGVPFLPRIVLAVGGRLVADFTCGQLHRRDRRMSAAPFGQGKEARGGMAN